MGLQVTPFLSWQGKRCLWEEKKSLGKPFLSFHLTIPSFSVVSSYGQERMNEGEDRKDRQASSYDMKIIKKEMKEEKGK